MDQRERSRSSDIKSAVVFLISIYLVRGGRFERPTTESFSALSQCLALGGDACALLLELTNPAAQGRLNFSEAVILLEYEVGSLAFEFSAKDTALFSHLTPRYGEHSRLNGCPVSLDHYTPLQAWSKLKFL